MKNPKHIAIICDGNRTWARLLGKNPYMGHSKGAKNIEVIVKAAIESKIEYLTLFLLSTENLIKRSKEEVDYLFSLFEKIIDYRELFVENQVKFQTVGDTTKLPVTIQKSLQELKDLSKNFKGITLTFAVNYGGRDELQRAADKYKEEPNKPFEDCLDSSIIPDVDILIRTGGFTRISNFLLWKLAYSEIFFVPTRWPDFSKQHLEEIIQNYRNVERKFGK